MELSNNKINDLYEEIKAQHKRYLEDYGVILPNLKRGGKFTKYALVLVHLYSKLNQPVNKTELTLFIRQYDPNVNDVQQARHLAAQYGWYIISKKRGDIEAINRGLKEDEYMLINLSELYPGFSKSRRDISSISEEDWENIKKEYGFRCVTCGSKENEPNFHYPSTKTKLQKGHMDPKKELSLDNIIPQCEKYNRPDLNYFVYDKKERVIKLSNPKFVLSCEEDVQKEIFNLLKKKYENNQKC